MKERKTLWKFLIVSVVISVASVLGLLSYDRFTSRFDLLLKGKEEPRILIWGCSYNVLKSSGFDWYKGLGSTTITQDHLEECYRKKFLEGDYWGWVYEHGYKYNTHNEYINMLLSFGVFGLFLFVFLLLYLFTKAWQMDNLFFQGFIIVFSLCCLTENFLARQYGIVSFSIFASLIIIEYRQQRALDKKS